MHRQGGVCVCVRVGVLSCARVHECVHDECVHEYACSCVILK